MRAFVPLEIARAQRELMAGAVIAVPTDTVYGLAVDPAQKGATERLFIVKTRPDAVALPVLVGNLDTALRLSATSVHDQLSRLGQRLWPGALTIVVARDSNCRFELGGDPTTIGLRVSGHEVMRQLCVAIGPLAVSSANLHGHPPCTTPEELRSCFGEQLFVLDGGTCSGEVSTVVDLVGPAPVLLREGAVPFQTVLEALM